MSKPRPAATAGMSRRATKQRWSAAKKAQARKAGTKMTAREQRRAAERAAAGRPDTTTERPDRRSDRSERSDRAERGERRYDRDNRGYRSDRDSRREYTSDRSDRGEAGRSYRDRDSRGYERGERRGYGNRPEGDERGYRSDRAGYGNRPEGDGRGYRSERAGYGNRSDRPGRGYRSDRDGRETGGYRGDREGRGYERGERRDSGERGYDRSERPTRVDRWGNAERRDDRGYGNRGYGQRDSRGYERGEGRGFDRDRSDDRGPGQRRYNREDGGGRGFERRGDNTGRDHRDDRDRQSRDRYRDDRRDSARGERPWRERQDRFERGPREDSGGRYERRDRFERPERRGGYERTARHDDAALGEFEAERLRRTERPRRVELPEDPNDGFAGLGVPMPIVERLARDGIAEPFPIQKATIPDAIAGRDVLGRGRTGSGKTMAFGIPVLTRLAGGRSQPHRPRALIMSPTRELAMQISDALAPLVREMGLRHKLVAGGMPYEPQIDALERGVDVLIATPGRMNDLVEKGAAALDAIEIVVLDEADLMADMGFLPEVSALLDLVPAGGQRLLFSATLDKGVDSLVETYLTDPVEHSTDEAKASVATMTHHIFLVEPQHKKPITGDIANRPGRTVVFVRTKLGADRVALQLRDQGVFAAALHGGLNQGVRNRILAAFKDGTLPVLVATDVASRGIHVDNVSAVLQVDPPKDNKDYLHRAGRTARAGSEGVVVTLALPHQRRLMKRIAADAGLEGVEPVRVDLGHDTVIAATGAERPSGVPVSEERLRAITDPPKRRPMRRQGGYGGRGRGGGYGGRGGGGRGYGGGRNRD